MSFDFWGAAKREFILLRLANTGRSVSSQVVVPILIGVWTGFSTHLLAISEFMFWGILSSLAITQLTLFLLTINSPFAAESFVQAARLEDQGNLLKDEVRRLANAQMVTFMWPFMEREYAKRQISQHSEVREVCAEMLAPIVAGRDTHFGIVPGEIWSFTVYLFDPSSKSLKPVWREKSETHPSSGPTRNWERGHGHVGMAFAKGEAIITQDASNPEESDLISPPKEKRREYDSTTYRAFAAIPIGGGLPDDKNGGSECVGVLVATSDAAMRFDKSNAFLLRHLASTLANVLERANIDSRLVWEEER